MSDLPPPLEDATEVVSKIRERIENKQNLKHIKSPNQDLLKFENDEKVAKMPDLVKETFESKPMKKNQPVSDTKITTKKSQKGGFGGFQSGFLSGKKSNVKNRQAGEKVIKPKTQSSNPLLIPEVQKEMKKELQSDDFLSSYGKTPFYKFLEFQLKFLFSIISKN